MAQFPKEFSVNSPALLPTPSKISEVDKIVMTIGLKYAKIG